MSEDPLNELLNDLPEASSPSSSPAETTPPAEDFQSPPPDEVSASLPDSEGSDAEDTDSQEPDSAEQNLKELAPPQPQGSEAPEPSVAQTGQGLAGRRSRRTLSARQLEQRRDAARHATGPRTARGKAQARLNAVKHGVSGHARFLWESMIALGENPEEFQHLLATLIQSLQPVGGAEMLLVEDIATLSWKKARLDRAQQGVCERQMELLEMERRRRSFEADLENVDGSPEQVQEHGLRSVKDSPAKFEKILTILEIVADRTQRNDFSENLNDAFAMLYGRHPTVREAYMASLFADLAQAAPKGRKGEEDRLLRAELLNAANEQVRDVSEQYQTYLQDKVEVSRARRQAALAPEGGPWPTMIRMENYLHRHIERKMKLLIQLQRSRRKLERQLEEANHDNSIRQRDDQAT